MRAEREGHHASLSRVNRGKANLEMPRKVGMQTCPNGYALLYDRYLSLLRNTKSKITYRSLTAACGWLESSQPTARIHLGCI
jgi:hypothetical protein